jgi:hypothetical protein
LMNYGLLQTNCPRRSITVGIAHLLDVVPPMQDAEQVAADPAKAHQTHLCSH